MVSYLGGQLLFSYSQFLTNGHKHWTEDK